MSAMVSSKVYSSVFDGVKVLKEVYNKLPTEVLSNVLSFMETPIKQRTFKEIREINRVNNFNKTHKISQVCKVRNVPVSNFGSSDNYDQVYYSNKKIIHRRPKKIAPKKKLFKKNRYPSSSIEIEHDTTFSKIEKYSAKNLWLDQNDGNIYYMHQNGEVEFICDYFIYIDTHPFLKKFNDEIMDLIHSYRSDLVRVLNEEYDAFREESDNDYGFFSERRALLD